MRTLLLMLAGGLAMFLELRQSQPERSRPHPGSFTRLLESQFHLVSIWQAVVQIPGIMLATTLNLWDLRWIRSSGRRSDSQNQPPFVWELGLGLASLFVLSYLFLWTGD